MMEEAKYSIDVICLTEIWNTDHINININGYHPPSTLVRKHKKGGGLCIYVNLKHTFNTINHEILNDHMECMGIKIGRKRIFCTYRPPNGNKDTFSNLIVDLINEHKANQLDIVGDFNLDLLKNNNFYTEILNLGFYPAIHKTTRSQGHSNSIIDNFITNSPLCESLIIPDTSSDHFPIIKIDDLNYRPPQPKQTFTRKATTENLNNLNTILTNTDWTHITNNRDPVSAHQNFFDILDHAHNLAIPLTLQKQREFTIDWMTPALRTSVKTERKLYLKKCNRPNENNIRVHRNYKKVLDRAKKKAKENYLTSKFNSNIKNSKEVWKCIYETIKNKKNKEDLSDSFIINNVLISDPTKISNSFNTFFNQIGSKLADKISVQERFEEFMPPKTDSTFNFSPITEEQLLKTCKDLQSKLSHGPDGISNKTLKHIFPSIKTPLTHLINLTLESGYFPERLKESTIIPIYKSEDRCDINNHRPISLCNSLSKLYEKIVHKQLYDFLEDKKILNDRQYGFRNKSSCEHAMLDLLNTIETNKANNKISNLIFLDLSKAFDTVSHEILLAKLEHYGITDNSLLWFKNYLDNRKHCSKYRDFYSEPLYSNIGVPQGSILGPLLFLVYINDISHTIDGTFLYADDTTIVSSNENPDTLIHNANQKMRIASKWFQANKLTLNAKKTREMSITPDHSRIAQNIHLNDTPIEKISHTSKEKFFKFLGFIMDEKLTWEFHTAHVLKKLNAANYALAITKRQFPFHAKKLMYFGLAQSHLEYGMPIWFNDKICKKITSIQKKMIRNINNSK